MTAVTHNRFLVPAWAVSLTLHGVVVTLAVLFAAEVRPIVQQEPFKWDVALVETAKTDSQPAPAPPAEAKPLQPLVRAVPPQPRPTPAVEPPPPDTAVNRVAPRQTLQMVHPEAQPPKPLEQREEPPPPPKVEQITKPVQEKPLEHREPVLPPEHTEPVPPPVTPVPEKPIEPVEQQVAELPKPRPTPVIQTKEPEPVHNPEPVTAQRQPVVESAPPETPPKSAPAESPRAEMVHESTSSHVRMEEPSQAANTVSPPGPAAVEAPMQIAKASAPQGAKTDHRWIAESLGRRLSELKRYPNEARVSRLQGKVILKAVIRSDGHLADVSVQRSSGHSILDEAAMEAVRLACPLHMQHDIGRPMIVVHVPMVYSLTN
jgi:periplasmic protein TonB